MTRARGFTLVEFVVVIVIMGILAGVLAAFIVAPVEAYLAGVRRAQMTDAADVAMRRMARDLRLALPNSVRVGGGGRFLEFIPTTDGGRYRTETGDILDFAAADDSFGYLGDSLAAAGNSGFVVVFNTGQRSPSGCATAPGGADAYEGCNRSAITALGASSVSFMTIQFPFDSPGHRFHLVPAGGPVTLACDNLGALVNGNGRGALRLYTGYRGASGDWGAGAPGAAPAVAANLLADYVSGCMFSYVSGVSASNGLVTLRLAITRANETITLHHQIHIDNVP